MSINGRYLRRRPKVLPVYTIVQYLVSELDITGICMKCLRIKIDRLKNIIYGYVSLAQGVLAALVAVHGLDLSSSSPLFPTPG